MCGPAEESFDWHDKRICEYCKKTIEFQDGKYSHKQSSKGWTTEEEEKFVCKTHTYEEIWKEK